MANVNFLKSVPLFKTLNEADLAQVAGAMAKKEVNAGTELFKQGDSGDAFYVVQEGQCQVFVRPADFIKVGDEIKLT